MKVVGCSIFRSEVEHVLGEDAVDAWLPAGLHVSDERLGAALAEALGSGDGTLCLYGACHPDIDAMLEKRGGRRLAAQSCVEAFLDPGMPSIAASGPASTPSVARENQAAAEVGFLRRQA